MVSLATVLRLSQMIYSELVNYRTRGSCLKVWIALPSLS